MTSEIAIVAIISACFPAAALLFSKLSGIAGARFLSKPAIISHYECGFAGGDDNFKYINDTDIIALSIALELETVLLFVCCVFNMKFQPPYGKTLVRILSGILLASIILAYKYLAGKSKNPSQTNLSKVI